MAVKFKDYYRVLGLSREATPEEIKSAYRKLARKHHPDVSGGDPGAEAKFKEINEAYEVLKDPERRKRYDSFGADVPEGADFRPPQGGFGGFGGDGMEFNVGGTGFSDFFEMVFGARRAGGGRGPFGGMGGFGQQAPRAHRGQDLETDIMVNLGEVIRGSKRQVSVRRQGGEAETYQVKVPAGIRDGQKIRLSGKGEARAGGGPAGDLFLRVRVIKHPDFRIDGDDLIYELALAPWEALFGTTVQIPTPDGKSVSLKIPAKVTAGKKFRLRGLGLPKGAAERGHLFAVVEIAVPESVSEEEESLWRKLSEISSFNPRA